MSLPGLNRAEKQKNSEKVSSLAILESSQKEINVYFQIVYAYWWNATGGRSRET